MKISSASDPVTTPIFPAPSDFTSSGVSPFIMSNLPNLSFSPVRVLNTVQLGCKRPLYTLTNTMSPLFGCEITLNANAVVNCLFLLTTLPSCASTVVVTSVDFPFTIPVTLGAATSIGEGRYSTMASIRGCTPILRKLDPHSTGVMVPAIVCSLIALRRVCEDTSR